MGRGIFLTTDYTDLFGTETIGRRRARNSRSAAWTLTLIAGRT
jgi:hypothetical protein